ncbi:MAG TPA: hypothetical protein PKE64_16520, partial [Anaerolineae bacterium]|nr:hypothetical protein [Anaerolineae bacterium]HMR65614.1 hypothetical protein [Anaerolineae bacterium]
SSFIPVLNSKAQHLANLLQAFGSYWLSHKVRKSQIFSIELFAFKPRLHCGYLGGHRLKEDMTKRIPK